MATLDYKPKVSLDEIMCEECMSTEAENNVRWKMVRAKKKMESGSREFEYDCTECGRNIVLASPVRDPDTYVCQRCYQEQAIPDRSRLEGMEKVDGSLYIRRKKK